MEFLVKKIPWLLILRPKNLFMIAMTMSILQYMVIIPLSPHNPALNHIYFPLFVFITLIIAGSGYLINDIFDYEIDKVNKPEKTYFSTSFTIQHGWFYYYGLVITGFILSVFVAVNTSHIYNLWLYPLFVWVLYGYAKKWKSSVLTGNVIVSLFVAFVWAILFYVEYTTTGQENRSGSGILLEFFIVYFVFAFLINLMREIVKDIEDAEGDYKQGIKTFPLVFGIKKAVIFVTVLQNLLILMIGLWLWFSESTQIFEIRIFYFLFIICFLLFIYIKLLQARYKKDFSLISRLIKMVMLFALLGMVLVAKSF